MSENKNDFQALLGEYIYGLCRLYIALEQHKVGLNLHTFLTQGLVTHATFSEEHGDALVKSGLLVLNNSKEGK